MVGSKYIGDLNTLTGKLKFPWETIAYAIVGKLNDVPQNQVTGLHKSVNAMNMDAVCSRVNFNIRRGAPFANNVAVAQDLDCTQVHDLDQAVMAMWMVAQQHPPFQIADVLCQVHANTGQPITDRVRSSIIMISWLVKFHRIIGINVTAMTDRDREELWAQIFNAINEWQGQDHDCIRLIIQRPEFQEQDRTYNSAHQNQIQGILDKSTQAMSYILIKDTVWGDCRALFHDYPPDVYQSSLLLR